MYRTVGNMIELLTKKHNLRVEIVYGDEVEFEDIIPDTYFYVSLFDRVTDEDKGWNYGSNLFMALDYLVNLKERGE